MKKLLIVAFLLLTVFANAQSNEPGPKIKTQVTPKRIIVTSGKISKSEFDTLVNHTLKLYKERDGLQLIVKSPGQKTFNHKIPEILTRPVAFKAITRKDNINETKPEPVNFRSSQK